LEKKTPTKNCRGVYSGEKLRLIHPTLEKDEVVLILSKPNFKAGSKTFEVPHEFAMFLVDEQTSNRARQLCLNVSAEQFIHARTGYKLFEDAVKGGLEHAEAELEDYRQHRPKIGPVQLYCSTEYGTTYSGDYDLTDGKIAFNFGVDNDEKHPQNVYIQPLHTGIRLTKKQYSQAISDLNGFFSLVQTLWDLKGNVADATLDKIKDAYFKNKKQMNDLLEKFGKIAAFRKYCGKICLALSQKKVYALKKGFLVYVGDHESHAPHDERGVYWVTKEGKLQKLDVEITNAKGKERIGKICKNENVQEYASECSVEEETLREIAAALKNVASELVLVLMP